MRRAEFVLSARGRSEARASRWRDAVLVVAVAGLALLGFFRLLAKQAPHSGDWPGVDETVVEHFARQAGAPQLGFRIAWVQGDLLLFAFLCAGLAAGFVLGYCGRTLFGEAERGRRDAE
ncbi:MAG TPA: hypothetical protein VFQ61_15030 [Polyangiaceae bacterium]|nr:hypothetical protein [Polyangiaceae bacterium]